MQVGITLSRDATFMSLFKIYYFDILNHIGIDHECDRRTDVQTELPLAIVCPNRIRCALKICIWDIIFVSIMCSV